MAELNVNDITTNTIDPTDKVYGFNADESKAPTVQTLLGAAPGIMAVGTCATAAATAAKAVTSANWTAKPGQSILIEFTNANTANNVTLSINQANAIPVYALNTSIRLGSGSIPAGPMIFTLSADGTKFYAHTVVVDTAVTSDSSNPVSSQGVDNKLKNYTNEESILINSNGSGYLKFTGGSLAFTASIIIISRDGAQYNYCGLVYYTYNSSIDIQWFMQNSSGYITTEVVNSTCTKIKNNSNQTLKIYLLNIQNVHLSETA